MIKTIYVEWRKFIFALASLGYCLFLLFSPQSSFAGAYLSFGAGAVINNFNGTENNSTYVPAPGITVHYKYQNHKSNHAFITQVGLGYQLQLAPHWFFSPGIRLSHYDFTQSGDALLWGSIPGSQTVPFSYQYNIEATQLDQVLRVTYMPNRWGYFAEVQAGVAWLIAPSY